MRDLCKSISTSAGSNFSALQSPWNEKRRYYADQHITLDLDDGVKINYGDTENTEVFWK